METEAQKALDLIKITEGVTTGDQVETNTYNTGYLIHKLEMQILGMSHTGNFPSF